MTTSPRAYDVAIVGAGAAGLAAAGELVRHGRSVCLLEARDRPGGRIYTRMEPSLAVPLELGAEFVHGRPKTGVAWPNERNALLIDAPQTRWILRNGRLQAADDLFDELRAALRRVGRPRKDLPLAQFLEGPAGGKLPKRLREFALTLVEGYDAADATRVSTLGTLDEWCGEGAADAPTFRPQHGYESLIHVLTEALDPRRVTLRLDTTVQEIRWKRGNVSIDALQVGQPIAVRAKRAIITLPLGVLQLPPQAPNAVRFVPALDAKQKALARLATGPVVKVILHFREPFWETLDDGSYRDAAFFHDSHAAFPTMWTMLPLRASLLVAWAAGPNAARLSGRPEEEIVKTALDCVAKLFGRKADSAGLFQGSYSHDWQADPFACGAYSYVVAGGGKAREELARPLDGTLFFAGEAAETGGESGTVTGALASAQRVVQQVLKSGR
jgi:monoamine oxidase